MSSVRIRDHLVEKGRHSLEIWNSHLMEEGDQLAVYIYPSYSVQVTAHITAPFFFFFTIWLDFCYIFIFKMYACFSFFVTFMHAFL